jgi:formate hydrogenlyase transcriptional activator
VELFLQTGVVSKVWRYGLAAVSCAIALAAALATDAPSSCFTIALVVSSLYGGKTPRAGRFPFADRGTLFLDEIGDMPLELQPKLLRVLQEQRFERLGGSQTIQVNVRVIAATNQDLWGMVQERKFRADLYYRLNVFPITLPPLRERRDDIPLLAAHFVQKFADRPGKPIHHVPADLMEALRNYDWPGNVRELQNFIERAVIVTTGEVLRPRIRELFPQTAAAAVRTLADAERAHIVETLRETNGVVSGKSGAAARLGLPRTSLISRMQRLGLTAQRPDALQPSGMGDLVNAAAAGSF